MKRAAVAVGILLSLVPGCRGPGADSAAGSASPENASAARGAQNTPRPIPAAYAFAAPARVRGSVLDAATGERLAGVEIHAGDVRAVSGADGRFEMTLPAGWNGSVTGAAGDGRLARLELLPLRPGVLEVVLRLAFP